MPIFPSVKISHWGQCVSLTLSSGLSSVLIGILFIFLLSHLFFKRLRYKTNWFQLNTFNDLRSYMRNERHSFKPNHYSSMSSFLSFRLEISSDRFMDKFCQHNFPNSNAIPPKKDMLTYISVQLFFLWQVEIAKNFRVKVRNWYCCWAFSTFSQYSKFLGLIQITVW